jgi:drug/metabolite transporter (DMT)-like permease
MSTMLISIFLLGRKKRYGWIFGIIASVFGVGFAVIAHSYAYLIANNILILLNINGYIKWKK